MDRNVLLKMPGQAIFLVPAGSNSSVGDLFRKCSGCDCYVMSEGKIIDSNEILMPGNSYTICPRLRGGKGGFGSMLRAIGAQIEKTTNREACRDLSGRRMRDVNNEKKMVEYLEKKAEREREREKKKREKLERLTQKPKHFFNDPDYDKNLHEAVEKVDKAVEKGFLAHTKKRKVDFNEKQKEPKIKKGLWLGEEEVSSSDSDSDAEEDASLKAKNLTNDSDHGESSSGATKSDPGKAESPPVLPSHDMDDSEHLPTNTNCDTTATDDADKVNGSALEFSDDTNCNTKSTDYPDGVDSSTGTLKPQDDSKSSLTSVDCDTGTNDIAVKRNDSAVEVPDPSEADGCMNDIGGSGDGVTTTSETKGIISLTSATTAANTTVSIDIDDIDLSKYDSADGLESLGLEVLKALLMKKGVKCGGSLRERAVRLMAVKDSHPDQIDPNLLASKSKRRNRPKK